MTFLSLCLIAWNIPYLWISRKPLWHCQRGSQGSIDKCHIEDKHGHAAFNCIYKFESGVRRFTFGHITDELLGERLVSFNISAVLFFKRLSGIIALAIL